MLLAIAIVSLIGSLITHVSTLSENYLGNAFIHIVAIMAWWPICTWFAITWLCVSVVWIIMIAALKNS